mmetsp:Transcript_23845/g.71702  ORF Transcript_23845/g.71702 Transcript_23845/m.71702 type:complete len:130 (-) Transcript_23845:30-419(-)
MSRKAQSLRHGPPKHYVPKHSDDLGGADAWRGSVFGSASTKAARPRFDPKLRRGELFYGQKRPLSTDVCPDEPRSSFLDRCPAPKKKEPAPPAKKKRKKAKVVAPPSSSSSSSDSSSSSSSDSSGSSGS